MITFDSALQEKREDGQWVLPHHALGSIGFDTHFQTILRYGSHRGT